MGLFSTVKNFLGSSTDYFKQAKTNQEDALTAAANTATSALSTAQDSLCVAAQIGTGVIGYDYISGKIMTTYSGKALAGAIGVSTPTILDTIVTGAATFIFKYPAAALGCAIGTAFFAAPEKLIKTVCDAGSTAYYAAETALDVVKCVSNLAIGTLALTAEGGEYITNCLYGNSVDGNSIQSNIIGENQLSIEDYC
jgi:hypothetical protein